ncbi:MAG: sugar ABC transporter substrate-binding protein [Actinomycetaceae bacterium]|nr:sugar ABC transporter substrate-binding protein [Actinomycetaceae bacterium]
MKYMKLAAVSAAAMLMLTACGGGDSVGGSQTEGGDSEGGASEITYSLWDSNQLPAYEQCAAKFTEESGITVKINQQGWDDYWTSLTTDIVSGTAPDVITNHVAYYPELAGNGQLMDLAPMIEEDGVDLGQYTGELASLWNKDGEQYGIPQDWDTIAIVYNAGMLEEAGLTEADVQNLTWNPQDGGTFGELIKKLTVDKNGVRGDEDGFDSANVETYGWGLETGGGVVGQTQWSWMALANGFNYLDTNPFGTEYQLSDPKLIEVLDWYQDQIEAGYVLPFEKAGQLGLEPMMEQGQAALITDGSWRIGTWANSENQDFKFAPLPTGPEGQKTIINGLAPSIVKSTKNADAAWEWVKFLTSEDCQTIVAESAVVFPSIPAKAEAAAAKHEENGVDVSAFVDIAGDPANLSYYPITDAASEIGSLAQAVVDDIEQLKVEPADALPQLNDEINALLAK